MHTRSPNQSQLKWSVYTNDFPTEVSWYLFGTNNTLLANFAQYTDAYKFYNHEECIISNPNTCVTIMLFNLAPNIGNIFYSAEWDGSVYKNVTHLKSNIDMVKFGDCRTTTFCLIFDWKRQYLWPR